MLDQKKFYINGEWVSPKKPNDLKVIDPSTEEECASNIFRWSRGCQ